MPPAPSSQRTGRAISEAEMLASIKQTAKALNFAVFHNTYAIGSDRGFPDLIIVGYGRIYAWELKGPKGRVRPEQAVWIDALSAAGIPAQIVWPDDYDDAITTLQETYQQAFEEGATS